MKKPVIFIVDDDLQVLRAVQRDLRSKYSKEYKIVAAHMDLEKKESPQEILDFISQLKLKGDEVALFLSDQRMPFMEGVELLEKASEVYPIAKRVLLTAYSDTDAAIKAINDVQLDYYLMKPWDPPEEKLYPIIDDLLEDWKAVFRPKFEGIKLVGYQWSPKSHEIKDFLAGNLTPYQWLDIETSLEGQQLVQLAHIERKHLPALFFEDGSNLSSPSIQDVGNKIGLTPKAQDSVYDVVIIGAGPAGLAAAVYGGSEGLKTLLIEKRAPGGQAGTSSRIENYLGFPSGLSGSDLARRAITQAKKFGIEFLSPQEVMEISVKDGYKILKLKDGSEIQTRSIVLTTGVDYRKLEAKGVDKYTGAGVYYGAATTEAYACTDQEVYIVGGGNSAGQAAMYLSKFAKNVYIVIRKDDLSSSMSQYLIDQIDRTNNINLVPKTVVVETCGDAHLEKIVLEDIHTKEQKTVEAASLFIFIGARPYTDWVPAHIFKNARGFVMTGRDMVGQEGFKQIWKQDREPYLLETSLPGVFAAGDVRAGAMNRVASAVGEGAMAIRFVHQYLGEV